MLCGDILQKGMIKDHSKDFDSCSTRLMKQLNNSFEKLNNELGLFPIYSDVD